jgi:hypothetical protein
MSKVLIINIKLATSKYNVLWLTLNLNLNLLSLNKCITYQLKRLINYDAMPAQYALTTTNGAFQLICN